jgi:uncharacterized membrane protein YcaP (DUF421 family)
LLIVFIRALLLYITVVVVMRIMGKRQIGQLQPFELVIVVLIAELAGVPIGDTNLPLFNGIVGILTLMLSQLILSYITLKSNKARRIVCGTPAILIDKGRIMEDEMRRSRYNINDLIEQLRLKDFPNIADVEYAILETDGQLSIIPKTQKQPVTIGDLNIPAEYQGLPLTLVIDGHVITDNLNKIQKDRQWLLNQVQSAGCSSLDSVLLASIDSSGRLFIQTKSGS